MKPLLMSTPSSTSHFLFERERERERERGERMPRTTTVELPGCPPLRALTFDVLGLVKVIEARSKQGGIPKVVERWGEPDSSKCILTASMDDRKFDPLLAVGRKNGSIEVLSPVSGEVKFSISNAGNDGVSPPDDPLVGLHLFRTQRSESSSKSCTLLTCSSKGKASVQSVDVPNTVWNVCGSGSICCCKVDASERYSVFGGKGVEFNMWDLEKADKIWTSKSPPKNSLGIFTPTWFTSVTYVSKDDHRKFVAGTNNHQVQLYDIAAQRRPVLSVDFRETPIKSVAEDVDGHTIYFGNGSGDLASIDIRTGKLLGCFVGKCSGSIRSIARHPELPVIASCGLDSYLRLWDIKSRQLLSAVFLKQHLTSVIIDSSFVDEETSVPSTEELGDEVHRANDTENQFETEEVLLAKRKKGSEESNSIKKKMKSKKKKKSKKAKIEADAGDDSS